MFVEMLKLGTHGVNNGGGEISMGSGEHAEVDLIP